MLFRSAALAAGAAAAAAADAADVAKRAGLIGRAITETFYKGRQMSKQIYRELALLVGARANCERTGNNVWHAIHTERAEDIVKEFLPSGSGWDCGTKLDFDASTSEKLVFRGSWHHMDDFGGYAGWTEHTVKVRPSLQFGFVIAISGCDRNGIKDYLSELFGCALRQQIGQDSGGKYHLVQS